jgi:hypothetical protein
MNVELIDYTGCGHVDPADYAAKFLIYTKSTRLEQSAMTRASIDTWPQARGRERTSMEPRRQHNRKLVC